MSRSRARLTVRIRDHESIYLFVHSPVAIVAALFVLLTVGGAILAPLVVDSDPYDPATYSLRDGFLPPVWQPDGDRRFVFGTDDQGRDMLASILYGARLSLRIAASAMALATVVGVTIGLIAGYYGGWFDTVVMRIADVQLSLPAILTALLIDGIARSVLPGARQSEFRIQVIITAIALSLWVNFARTTRAAVFVERNKEYVQSAEIMGEHPVRILGVQVLPNVLAPLLVIMTVDLGRAILLEATLSFLGVGLPPNAPSLGTLIRIGMEYLFSGQWWILWLPALFLVAMVISVNLLGDFLRDLFNPRLR